MGCGGWGGGGKEKEKRACIICIYKCNKKKQGWGLFVQKVSTAPTQVSFCLKCSIPCYVTFVYSGVQSQRKEHIYLVNYSIVCKDACNRSSLRGHRDE